MKALQRSCSRRLFTSYLNNSPSPGSSSALFHSSSPLSKRKKSAPVPETDTAPSSNNGTTPPAAAASERLRNLMVEDSLSDEDPSVLSQSELAFGGSYDRSAHILDMLKDGKVKQKPIHKKGPPKPQEKPVHKKGQPKPQDPQTLTKHQRKKLRRKLKKNLLSQQLGDHMMDRQKSASSKAIPWKEISGTESGSRDSSVASVETGRIRDNLSKDRAPHLPRTLLYTRRVEGIVPPMDKSVLQDTLPPSEHNPIAQLSHNLDRVLFNPGVHLLRDFRTQVYNFSSYLEKLPPPQDFAFERLAGFIPSSRDEDLRTIATREGRTFAGSTSSLSGLLSHIYFLISSDKDVNTTSLSRHFQYEPTTFTPGQRMPAGVVLNYFDGVYTIDSDKLNDISEKNVLTWMVSTPFYSRPLNRNHTVATNSPPRYTGIQGTLMENFFTKTPEEFERFTRKSENPFVPEGEGGKPKREAYRYAMSDKFVMRSQLDCVDPRLPGTGVFDLKTRAVYPIRHDNINYDAYVGYTLKAIQGPLDSFEKEYYDMIRSAFLKYQFQCRIGNMDGVFVAYHNIEQVFGFQYIPLSEMDDRLFGAEGRGDRVFEKCVKLLEVLVTEAVEHFPRQSIRMLAEKQDKKDVMNIFLQPALWDKETQGDIPTVQLDVSVSNYSGDNEVRGSSAVSKTEDPWTILWAISTAALPPREIEQNLSMARMRQFRYMLLPTGATLADAEERWHKFLNFGGAEPPDLASAVPFVPENWMEATKSIQQLREMAREAVLMREGKEGGIVEGAQGQGKDRTEVKRLGDESEEMERLNKAWQRRQKVMALGKRLSSARQLEQTQERANSRPPTASGRGRQQQQYRIYLEDRSLSMSESEVSEQAFCDIMDEMTSSLSSVREQLTLLREKQTKSSDADLKEGISLITLKHHLLLSYIQSLVVLNSRRALGHSLHERTVPSLPFSAVNRDARGSEPGDLVDSTIESRLVLEKIKVLETKMRYQIEKLVRVAEESTENALDDPLAFRPNPQALMHANMSDEDDEDAADGEVRQDGIYRPPKLAPMPYTESSGKDKRSRRAPIPTALSSLAQLDPSKPYLESTSGLGAAPIMQSTRAREIKRMTEFEEDNFTRLVLKKKDDKRRRKDEEDIALGGSGDISGRRRGGGFEDEFTDVLKSVGRDRRSAIGDGYEELRTKGRKAGALARARSRSEVDDLPEDSPRQRKRGKFEKEVRTGRKRMAAKSKR